MRRNLTAFILAIALVLAVAPAALAAFNYAQGDTVALGFNSLPSGYSVTWTSDRDGFLMRGNPLRTSSLSVGTHKITYVLTWTPTGAQAYRGTVDVVISGPAASNARSPAPSPTPTGRVAPGEFEPVTELLLGTPDAYSVEDMYPEFLDALRGVARTRIYVDNRYVQYELEDIFVNWGVDDADYTYATTPIDSIWMRDYGPLFTKNGSTLEVVDLNYYPERPYDDAVPGFIAREKGMSVRPCRVYWEGGNFTADGRGNLFASDVLYSRNYGSNSQIDSTVSTAFGGRVTPLDHMRNDGGTGHIDMFVLMTGARSFLLNKFSPGHQNAARMDQHASLLQGMGYSVTRLALADTGFSSYTNGLIVNNVALVPTYNKSTTDNAALAAYRAAGYRTVGIDCRRIIQWSGAIHCITITVPR